MESTPGHRAGPSGRDEVQTAIGGLERRASDRHDFHGWLVLEWHHRPGDAMRYHTIDVSETGARIRTSCTHPEGMTGTAIELVPESPAGTGDERLDPIPIRRSFIVVWSRAVRRADGRLDHHEAGLRFF